jgi:hypothetical protein
VLATSFFSLSLCVSFVVFFPRLRCSPSNHIPLPPYVCSSRVTPDEVLSITSLSSGGSQCFYITGSSSMFRFFHFGGSQPPHKVQSLFLCSSTVHMATRLTISGPVDFL